MEIRLPAFTALKKEINNAVKGFSDSDRGQPKIGPFLW